MLALDSYGNFIRDPDFRYTGYLATIPHTVILRTAFDPSGAVTYPVTSLRFSDLNGDGYGDYTDVQEGMLVKIYDGTTSDVKGLLRIATGGTTSSVMQVNEFSQIEIDVVSGDAIEVIDAYMIRDMLVSATSSFNKDSRVAYTDQGSNPPPVANGGGAWCGHTDPGELYATVDVDGSRSFTVDPDSDGSLTYSWDVQDCTIVSGSLTDAQITLQVPIGFRHLTLTVTDASNSKSAVKHIPINVFDYATRPALHVRVNRRYSTRRQGWSMEFELPAEDEALIDTFPDGCLVIYWENEYRGGHLFSYGSVLTNRSHIKFVGFLVRDSVEITYAESTARFEAVSPLQILEQTPALNQLMVQKTSPTNWRHIKTLTLNRALWYLTWWHSTLMLYFDFTWASAGDLGTTAYPRLAVNDIGNLADQLRDVADAVNLEVTCDACGQLLFNRKLNYLSEADRDAKITTLTLQPGDILRLNMTREHRGKVKYVLVQALNASGTVIQAQSGAAPSGHGIASEVLDRQIVTNQSDANQRAEAHFAALNGLYRGRYVPQDVTLELSDSYDVFDPAYSEWLKVILPASYNPRGASFDDDDRWIIDAEEVIYAADTGEKTIVLTIDHETFAENAIALT